MITSLLLLAVGLAILIAGAEGLIRGASALAERLGVSPLVVGMTVVAFGTSTPELVVNLLAAVRGNGDIAFGNIIGSNIANIGLILAASALLRPLDVHRSIITREIPMMLLTAAVGVVMALDAVIDGGVARYGRTDGIVLLLLFGVFLYYTIAGALAPNQFAAEAERAAPKLMSPKLMSPMMSIVLIAVGLIGLSGGGHLTVTSASDLAEAMGVPQVIIGLTLVAIGTSLPELATSLLAAWRGQSDLAMGNIIGSNIYNLLFIFGISATVRPIPLPQGGMMDLIAMSALSLILLPLSVSQKQISRVEGGIILALYLGYTVWRVM
jgi:cation:H+ antiporter